MLAVRAEGDAEEGRRLGGDGAQLVVARWGRLVPPPAALRRVAGMEGGGGAGHVFDQPRLPGRGDVVEVRGPPLLLQRPLSLALLFLGPGQGTGTLLRGLFLA